MPAHEGARGRVISGETRGSQVLNYEIDSPIRVRDKKETAVWITLICVMAVLLCVAILMPRLFVPGGLFGPPEGGAWWAYGETEPILGTIIGKGIVRFVSDTQWEMEVMDDCMYGSLSSGSAETKGGRMWCTGEYEFVGEPGEGVLRMRIVPDMPYLENGAILNPANVRICGADGGIVLNGEWVEYTPDETGVYNIKIAMHSSQAGGQISSDEATINFYFLAPNTDDGPGYYYADEQAYLDSLSAF